MKPLHPAIPLRHAVSLPSPVQVRAIITDLQPGEWGVYHEGYTGWLGQPGYEDMIDWLYSPIIAERFIFVQRKMPEVPNRRSIFQYIAIRRTK